MNWTLQENRQVLEPNQDIKDVKIPSNNEENNKSNDDENISNFNKEKEPSETSKEENVNAKIEKLSEIE